MSSSLKNCTQSVDRESLLAIGVIRKPHGVRGEASVEPWTQDPARFDLVENVYLVSPDEKTIVSAPVRSIRYHGSRVLLAIEGIETPEEIRNYSRWSVEIPEQERLETDEDEYYLYELENLAVVDRDGKPLGQVIAATEGGGGILLTVRGPSGTEFDLPFVRAICVEIDLEQGHIVAEMPEGLDALEEAPIADRRETRRMEGTLHDPLPAEPKPEPPPRAEPELRLDVVTIFPPMFDAIRNEGVLARALRQNIIDLHVWDLRDFTGDRHRSTDDEAYGGGAGMVMLADPFFRCLDQIRLQKPGDEPHVILLSPQGEPFRDQTAQRLAGESWLVLLCGRYEGVDERVREAIVDEEISIGDYVVSGGELPAMVVIDAVSRMVKDVVGDRNSIEADSFYNGLLDHPHYTRPAEVRGMKVPEVLLSGHAERIRQWRKKKSLEATLLKRPDLLEGVELDDEGRKMLDEIESKQRRDR
ncbi:MAG: tRNA (guanosine(37)-N1)-methyltransferase TrmD [Acidobacteria bacterium]|nr:tRNA (guanosine(37)-N1)-methyltransferase TrmD [Acidobacteriota bacterium]